MFGRLLISMFLTLVVISPERAFSQDVNPVANFYDAFARRDFRAMGASYSDSSGPVFSDPIFPGLEAREARAMWHMILESAHDLQLTYQIEEMTESSARVAWRAIYTFSSTGNKVVNEVVSTLQIENGKIVQQKDEFDLCNWAGQALGSFKSYLVCWFPDRTIRSQAATNLKSFIDRHPEYR